MKARGGYLTAFTLSLYFISIIQKGTIQIFNLVWKDIAGGHLFSQPFGLPGLLPLVAYQYMQHKSARKLVLFLQVAAPSLVIF